MAGLREGSLKQKYVVVLLPSIDSLIYGWLSHMGKGVGSARWSRAYKVTVYE